MGPIQPPTCWVQWFVLVGKTPSVSSDRSSLLPPFTISRTLQLFVLSTLRPRTGSFAVWTGQRAATRENRQAVPGKPLLHVANAGTWGLPSLLSIGCRGLFTTWKRVRGVKNTIHPQISRTLTITTQKPVTQFNQISRYMLMNHQTQVTAKSEIN
jgi:hypothetical protein